MAYNFIGKHQNYICVFNANLKVTNLMNTDLVVSGIKHANSKKHEPSPVSLHL